MDEPRTEEYESEPVNDLESAYQKNANGGLIGDAARPGEAKVICGLSRDTVRFLLGVFIGWVATCALLGGLGGAYWTDMPWQGWVSLYLMVTCVFLLVADQWDASLTFFGVLVTLLVLRIVTVQEALDGFSNSAVASIAVLCVVAAAIEETTLLEWVVAKVLRHPKSTQAALLRFVPVVIVLSAFTNNTPIVLIFIRVLQSWAVRINLPLTRLLMPLSFASILGGACTIIGTSTNLVVVGLAGDTVDLGFFEIGILGLPLSAIGMLYMVVGAKYLLPEMSARSQYMPVSLQLHRVEAGSMLLGKTVELNGLDKIPGATLVCVRRRGVAPQREGDPLLDSMETFVSVAPEQALEEGDYVALAGIPECVADVNGLTKVPVADEKEVAPVLFECHIRKDQVEISVHEFEQHFGCRVLALTRAGKTLPVQLAETVTRNDIVVVEANYGFLHHTTAPQFSNVRMVEEVRVKKQNALLRKIHPWLVLALVTAMIVVSAFEWMSLFTAASIVAVAVVALRVLSWNTAMASVQGKMLLLISCSFALALALERTGVANNLARGLSLLFRWGGAYTQLLGIYIGTTLLTSVVSNAAAASVMYPIIVSMVEASPTTLSLKAALYVLMISASFAYMTPIGYQTNLMVEAAAGYSWFDFFRFGGPLTLVCALVAPGIAMGAWPVVLTNATATTIATTTAVVGTAAPLFQ